MKIELKQREFSELEFKEIHNIVYPADVRQSDVVHALVRSSGSQEEEFVPVRVWKMSPLGIELLPESVEGFHKGDLLDLKLIVGSHTTNFDGLVVAVAPAENERHVLGIRLTKKPEEKISHGGTRRRGSRWICSSQFDPVCMAANPLQFNDFLYFKIRDISESGLRAITSLRNKFIVPGMEFQTQISFPLTSQVSMPLRVTRVSLTAEHGKDYLEVGLEFCELTGHQREVIGQYLVQFSDAESLKAIRDEGFFPTSLTKGVDYQYIKTAEEFKEVLELRLLANRRTGKVPEHYTALDMADLYDTRSRIIVGRYNGKIIGTIRLAFNELGERLEHESYVDLPSNFPRSDQILECARAATHPDFRGSDLWNTLIQHVTITAVQANRSFCLLSTTAELLPMYLRLGFTDSGLRYTHELYPDKEQIVLYIDIREIVLGHGVGPLYWNAVWRAVGNHLAQADRSIAEKMSASIRVRAYLLFSPIARIITYFSSKPRKKAEPS